MSVSIIGTGTGTSTNNSVGLHRAATANTMTTLSSSTSSPPASLATTMSAAVPLKFYQVCRLCLTVVSDTDAVKLSVFGGRGQSNGNRSGQRPHIVQSLSINNCAGSGSSSATASSVIIRNDLKFNNNREEKEDSPATSVIANAGGQPINAGSARPLDSTTHRRHATPPAASSSATTIVGATNVDDGNSSRGSADDDDGDDCGDAAAYEDDAALEREMENCDESQLELMQRIYTFLDIEVSVNDITGVFLGVHILVCCTTIGMEVV